MKLTGSHSRVADEVMLPKSMNQDFARCSTDYTRNCGSFSIPCGYVEAISLLFREKEEAAMKKRQKKQLSEFDSNFPFPTSFIELLRSPRLCSCNRSRLVVRTYEFPPRGRHPLPQSRRTDTDVSLLGGLLCGK